VASPKADHPLAPFTPLSRKEQQAIRDEAMRTMTDFAVAFDH